MSQINVTECLSIFGKPATPEQEKNLGVTLDAHFSLIVHEGNTEELKQRLETVRAHYLSWLLTSAGLDPEYRTEEDRRYRMMIWLAENEVKVAEDRTYKLVREVTK